MGDENDPFLAEMLPQIFGQFDPILRHAIKDHGGLNRGTGSTERSTRASLVPLHYCEALFPRCEESE